MSYRHTVHGLLHIACHREGSRYILFARVREDVSTLKPRYRTLKRRETSEGVVYICYARKDRTGPSFCRDEPLLMKVYLLLLVPAHMLWSNPGTRLTTRSSMIKGHGRVSTARHVLDQNI